MNFTDISPGICQCLSIEETGRPSSELVQKIEDLISYVQKKFDFCFMKAESPEYCIDQFTAETIETETSLKENFDSITLSKKKLFAQNIFV